jgi:hypothetical protein
MGDKVGYTIVKEEHTIKKIILPQDTVFSVEQSTIIGAIQLESNNRHEEPQYTNYQRERITLLSVSSHKGIPGNEKANQAAKEALDEDISTTERNPPDDLKKWLTEENFKKRDQRWKSENNEMKGNQTLTERRIQKECQGKSKWQYLDSELGIATHYAPSATPIYPLTTYCGNAKKLRTREQTWT